MKQTADFMNKKIYLVSIPEIYTPIIPKYYTRPTKADLPRINGVAVKMDEFIEKFPEYSPEQEFTPDMVYMPPEQNVAKSYQSIAGMVDMIFNNVTFCLFDPMNKYPEILKILTDYIKELREAEKYDARYSVYLKKAEEARLVMQDCYNRFKNAYAIKVTGQMDPEFVDNYATISKKFMNLGD